jgi:hypothetical protein
MSDSACRAENMEGNRWIYTLFFNFELRASGLIDATRNGQRH